MIKYILLGVVVLIIFIIVILFIVSGNKLKTIKIKIDEAEENITLLLTEKYTILSKIDKFIKKKSNEEYFKGLYDGDIEELDNLELNKKLSSYDKTITELYEYNKDLEYVNEELKDFERYTKNNINRLATEKYYNDNVTIYNELLEKFPANIIAKFKGCNKKDIFSNEKEEIFEILKS